MLDLKYFSYFSQINAFLDIPYLLNFPISNLIANPIEFLQYFIYFYLILFQFWDGLFRLRANFGVAFKSQELNPLKLLEVVTMESEFCFRCRKWSIWKALQPTPFWMNNKERLENVFKQTSKDVRFTKKEK